MGGGGADAARRESPSRGKRKSPSRGKGDPGRKVTGRLFDILPQNRGLCKWVPENFHKKEAPQVSAYRSASRFYHGNLRLHVRQYCLRSWKSKMGKFPESCVKVKKFSSAVLEKSLRRDKMGR